MSILSQRFLSLCLLSTTIASTIALTAPPVQSEVQIRAQTESKLSQCKRLNQAFNDYINDLKLVAPPKSRDSKVLLSWMDKASTQSDNALKRLRARKFSDLKIRQFHQRGVTLTTEMSNHLTTGFRSAKNGNLDSLRKAQRSILAMQDSPTAKQLDREIQRYCGTP